jgi:hypothetical protein
MAILNQPGVANMAGAPQALQMAYMRDPRLRLAQQLQLQGADSSPVQHWTQGAARLAQALAGGYVQDKADADYAKQAGDYQNDMRALYAPVQEMKPGQGGAGPRPDAQMQTRPANTQELIARIGALQSPYAMQEARGIQQFALQQQAAQEAEARKPFNLRPGERRMAPDGRLLAENPIAEKPQAPPASVAEFQFAQQNGFRGNFMDFQRAKGEAGRVPDRPARPMTPQERAQFGIPENVPAFMGGDGKPATLSVPRQEAAWQIDPKDPTIQVNVLTGERKALPGAEKAQEKVTQAENALGDTERMIASARDLLNHPGRQAATGFSSTFNFMPGTDAYGFKAKLATLKAQVFLPEVQKMVGMGALSNAEGEKIAAAFAALDPGMKESEFQKSLEDAISRMEEARGRFAQRAGRPVAAPAQGGWSIQAVP